MTEAEIAEFVTDMDAVEAAAFVEKVHAVQLAADRLIPEVVEAVHRRAWLALGYPTWAAMCEGEKLRLPRDVTAELRAGGLSIRAIAAVTNVDPKTVRNDLGGEFPREDSPPAPVVGLDGKTYGRTEPDRMDGEQPLPFDDEPTPQPEPPPREPAPRPKLPPAPVMLQLRTHTGETVEYPKPASRATFNETTGDGISWAAWSWNPVTGCLHGCDYCYARAIAARFPDGFPVGFTPLFHEERLDAPANTTIPAKYRDEDHAACGNGDCEICAHRRVFVCSMADLYGRWVPDEWIQRVHAAMLAAPEWQYILLTKFPSRYVGLDLPPGAWVGTSVDEQKRVRIAEDAFRKIDGVKVKWLSLEPLREPLEFTDLSMFDWVVIGAQTETRQPDGMVEAFAPPFEWVARIALQAKEAGCRVHLKPNLFGRPGMVPLDEYPE